MGAPYPTRYYRRDYWDAPGVAAESAERKAEREYYWSLVRRRADEQTARPHGLLAPSRTDSDTLRSLGIAP